MRATHRRDFLKFGAALPLALQARNSKAATQPERPPRRIMFICNSLGFYKPYFFPSTRGDLSTSRYLQNLTTSEKLTVFENLYHPGMQTSNHDSEKSFLTGAPRPEAAGFVNSISLDQALVPAMGTATRYPFLPLSLYDRGWGCSWNSRGVAIPPLHDERLVFNRLFGEEDLTEKRRQIENDGHIIACLKRDLRQLESRPAATGRDASEIDSYRTVITELEQQLKHEAFWLQAKKPEVTNPLRQDSQFAFSAKIANMLELSKLAFQTDSTRLITFSLDWIYGAIKVPGATGGWHTLSHHGGRADRLESLSRIETDILRHLNRFLSDLDAIPQGDGSLLDYTTVVIGSNFGDASSHTCHQLPIIVAGGGYRHQTHVVADRPMPLCNLWLELLQHHNVDAGQFGSSERSAGLLTARGQ